MTALLLQTLLLTVPAFFIGAAMACGLRRLLHPAASLVAVDDRAQPGPVAPMPQYAPQARQRETLPPVAAPAPAAAPVSKPVPAIAPAGPVAAPAVANAAPAIVAPATGNRFDDTLKTRPVEPPRPAPPPPAAPITDKPALVVVPAAVRPVELPAQPLAARVTPAKAEIVEGTAAVAAVAAAATAVANVTKVSAPTVAAAVVVPSKPLPMAEPLAAPAPTPAAKPVPAAPSTLVVPLARDTVVPTSLSKDQDDLTRISDIDPALSAQLEKLGVTRYGQIAAWRKPDVDAISQSLGFQGRIEQENWIEQAQILTTGNETHYSQQRTRVRAAMAAAPDVRSSQIPVDDTATIAPQVAERAAFTPAPVVTAVEATPLLVAPIAASAPLASSAIAIATAAAAAATAAATIKNPIAAPPSAAAPLSPPAVPAPPVVSAAVVQSAAPAKPAASDVASVVPLVAPLADPPAVAPAVAAPPPAVAVRPVMAPTRDVLQRIGSINAEVENLLSAQGVTRYSQIASWGPSETERFDRLLGSQGRIARENWVEQAQILAKDGNTTYSRDFDRRAVADAPPDPATRPMNIADAIRANTGAAPPRADIAGLRSVRSDAYRAPVETPSTAVAETGSAAGTPKVVRSAEVDDLKRIRGIGVLIEKRLNSIGTVSYGQIADWTNDDIGRVSATLDFQGRIERENWVEQARILAAGGETEFSRRVKLGEVETPKAR